MATVQAAEVQELQQFLESCREYLSIGPVREDGRLTALELRPIRRAWDRMHATGLPGVPEFPDTTPIVEDDLRRAWGSAIAWAERALRGADDQPTGFAAPRDIAVRFEVALPALRKRLERERKSGTCRWIENADRGGRDPQFLYDVGSIRHVIDHLKASSSCPPRKR